MIVDTNVVSYLLRNDTRAQAYRPHLAGHLLAISFMTRAEILLGARLRNWGQARRRQMEEYLRSYVEHPYDARLCEVWAEVTDAAQRSGRPIPCADAWIAATALLHDAALVTHDPDDFAGVPRLRIVSAKPGRPPRV